MVTYSRNADVVEALDLSEVNSVDYRSREDLTVELIINYQCSCYAKKIAQRLKLIYWNADVVETELTTIISNELFELIKQNHPKVINGR